MANSYTPVGINTNSPYSDFYVYEWRIKETKEIFYVGKGRKNRYQEFHQNNLLAEKIRAEFETEIIFVAEELTESEALQIETDEIVRILESTDNILTNVSTPCGMKNAWSKSQNTPPLCFEQAPVIYTTDVEEHYFNLKSRFYDVVDISLLKSVVFIDRNLWLEHKNIIYGGKYERYYEETLTMIQNCGGKKLSSKYAKSVSAWIVCSEISLSLLQEEQAIMFEKTGKIVPVFHLIDVWKVLKSMGSNNFNNRKIEINPINSRIPLSEIPPISDEIEALTVGRTQIEKAFEAYYAENYVVALEHFDKARAKGCIDPTMYNYYAIIYRKLKDYENEIDILSEAIKRYENLNMDIYGKHILNFKERRKKSIALLEKAR